MPTPSVPVFGAAVAVFLAISACSAQAQSVAASATAVVVTPLAIQKTADFNFGKIVPGLTAGTVILSTAGTRTIGSGGTVLGNATSASAAQLSVAGDPGATLSISITGGVLSNGAGVTMPMSNFVLKVGNGTDQTSSFTGTLSGTGTATLAIGGTLSVGTAASTPNGTYATSNSDGQDVTITVNYN